jgi:hypothetical protein
MSLGETLFWDLGETLLGETALGEPTLYQQKLKLFLMEAI